MKKKLKKQKNLNWHHKKFFIPENILKDWRKIGKKGLKIRKNWQKKFEKSNLKNSLSKQFKFKELKRDKDMLKFLKEITDNTKIELPEKSSYKSLNFYIIKLVIFLEDRLT